MAFLTTLTREFSPRVSTTEQERETARFLAEQLESLGYDVQLQPFTVDQVSSELLVVEGTESAPREVESFAMSQSGPGRESGVLVSVGRALRDDVPPGGLVGKIALIERGDITFESKVTRVADAGALAAVLYNNRPGPFRGTLGSQSEIPAVALSRESGETLLQSLSEGDIEATVAVVDETSESQNVIAEKPGTGSDERFVVLGGHYDTVPDVPGANDNGSGVATLLTLAELVAENDYPFALRFIGFGSEELGLVGSRHYVDTLGGQQRSDIIAMLNFDALSAGETVQVLGDPDLVSRVAEYAQDNAIGLDRAGALPPGVSSDHSPFEQLGVPILFFLDDDVTRIHTPEDSLEHVNPLSMGSAAVLAMALLDSLAGR